MCENAGARRAVRAVPLRRAFPFVSRLASTRASETHRPPACVQEVGDHRAPAPGESNANETKYDTNAPERCEWTIAQTTSVISSERSFSHKTAGSFLVVLVVLVVVVVLADD